MLSWYPSPDSLKNRFTFYQVCFETIIRWPFEHEVLHAEIIPPVRTGHEEIDS